MTLPAPTPLTYGGGGGGGGGLSAEADEVVYLDQGNSNQPFIRRYRKGTTGVQSAVNDFELDGSTAYVVTGPVIPSGLQPVGTAASFGLYNVTYQRLANSSVTIPAGALSIQYVVIADGVTVEGVAVPAGVAITHEVAGGVAGAVDFVADVSGDVLIATESAA